MRVIIVQSRVAKCVNVILVLEVAADAILELWTRGIKVGEE
jgi:hypothetical protein